MTHEASASSSKSPSLIALLWVMVKRMALLMVTPGSNKSIEGLWAEIERALGDMLFEQAKHVDASLFGLDPADFDIQLVWTRSGCLDFRIQPRAHTLAKAKAAYRDYLLDLRKQRLAISAYFRRAAIRGASWFNRISQIILACEMRRRRKRHRNATHIRARAPGRINPLQLVPP